MKSKTILVLHLLIIFTSIVNGQNLLDFGQFKIEVLGKTNIAEFVGEKGDVIKASKRSNQLIEIKLEISTNETGEFSLYPKMFSCMFSYRGVANVAPAAALGTKVKLNGTVNEYWYTDPEVSVIIGVNKNDKFIRYLIIELPKETGKYFLIGPKVIAELDK
jgi:hypothetical protein